MEHDHKLVGALINRAQEIEYPSLSAFHRDLKVSRATAYRLINGDPRVKAATLRRAEHLLGFGHGLLDAVREHDTTRIAQCDLRDDLRAWLLDQLGAGKSKRARNRAAG